MIERQRLRQREKQAPRLEPDAGLDPGTPGSRPGPKAGTKPLSHPGIPSPYKSCIRDAGLLFSCTTFKVDLVSKNHLVIAMQ